MKKIRQITELGTIKKWGLVMALYASMTLPVSATLLVYEGFDYTTGSDNLAGNNGGVGWGASSWAETGNASGSDLRADVIAALSFSDYSNTGNAMRLNNNNNAGSPDYRDQIASRQLTGLSSVASGSTLYMSYLFRQGGSASFAFSSGLRVSDSMTTGGTLSFQQNNLTRFNSDGPDEASLGYGSSATSSASAVTAIGTTYLVISKFENVGGAGAQNASLWLLDTSNYDAIKAGGITEVELDANNVTKITDSSTGITLDSSDYIQFYGNTAFGIANQPEFDEFRIFTDLNDINAVPEPSSILLVSLGAALLIGYKRRKQFFQKNS